MAVELVAGDAGLHQAVQVLGVDLEDLVHLHQIEGHAALQRRDVPFERGPGAIGDHRHPMRRARLHDRAHLLGGARERDRIRRRAGVIGLILAVLLADRDRRGQPVAEQSADRIERRGDARSGDGIHDSMLNLTGIEHSTRRANGDNPPRRGAARAPTTKP